MQKQAPTLGKLLVMVVFALSCFGLLLFLWLAFGGATPFASKGYRLTIPFKEAGQIAIEADVRISGVTVGKVKSIDLNRDSATTDVLVELDERYAPLPRDARAIQRQKTLLGETYIEITPGSPGSGAPQVPEGGRLALGNVDESVELDEIFRALDPRTRTQFQIWLQRQATALNGRGRDISDSLGNLAPTAEDATELLEVLNAQETAVSGLVRNTGVVFDALGERDGQLASLVTNSNRVFDVTARRDAELQEVFRILPTFQDESRLTLERLERFAVDTDPLVTQLRPAARELTPTLRSLERLAPDLRALFRDVDPLIDASRRGLPAVDTFLDELEPLLGQLDPFLRQVNPPLEGLAFYRQELNAFFANTVASTNATDSPPGANGERVHYLRTTNPINPEVLAQYPRRIGSNRPNPYQFPGAFAGLAGGLPVFEDRHCGNGIPTLTPQDLPLLPPTLRNLVNEFVFGPTGVPPAPPCRRQGQFPALGDCPDGTAFDYPHVCPAARPDATPGRTPAPRTAARWDRAGR